MLPKTCVWNIKLLSLHYYDEYFFLNNQPDALIIKIYSVIKTLHISGIFSARHQEISTLHSALVSFNQVLMTASKQNQDGTLQGFADCLLAGPGWNCSSILVLLESCLQTCMAYTIVECTENKLQMVDRRNVRNM